MRYLFSLLAIVSFVRGNAQDIHFSQTAQTPLLINPAAAGVFDGWQRAIINQRSQWLGATTQFMTTNVAGDVTLFKKERGNRGYLGLGGMFNTDVGGDGRFGTQTGSLTVSGILPTKSGSTLSAGIQGGFGGRKGDISKLSFESQWNSAQYAFDPTINSGEMASLNKASYIDASAGFYYVLDAGRSSFFRDQEFKFQLGAAVYHINQPILKFTNGSDDHLHRKYVIHSGIVYDLEGSKYSIDGNIVQFIQGGHYETILGTMLRYRLSEGTKLTGFSQKSFFGFGLYMRVKDAIIPSVLIDYKGFKFGISYDVTISKLRRVYGGGSLEFSISYSNLFKGVHRDAR